MLLIAVICALLSTVSFKSVDSLLRPPKNKGDNLELQTAFEAVAGDRYSFKAPISGDYNSSFISVDINGDGDNEVLVFYSDEKSIDSVKINILDKINDKWVSVVDIESDYSDVHKVDFADINGDGSLEIILGYSIFETKLTNTLNIYRLDIKNDTYTAESIFTNSYTDYLVLDINADSIKDLLIFDNPGINNFIGIKATYFDFAHSRIYNSGEYLIDPALTSIKSLMFNTDADSGETRVYVDGYRSDSYMITDVFAWDSTVKKFRGCFTADKKQGISHTVRKFNISCRDTDNDSVVEIPIEDTLPFDPEFSPENTTGKTVSLIKWSSLDNGELIPVNYELINIQKGYSILLGDDFSPGSYTVKNEADTGLLTFYGFDKTETDHVDKTPKKKKEDNEPPNNEPSEYSYPEEDRLFSVLATPDNDNSLYELSGYRFIKNDNRNSYYCQIYEKGKVNGLTKEKIKNILIT